MNDSVGVIPPWSSDCPAGSHPNEMYGTSGLNWRGAGPGPGRTGPTPTARAATAATASTEVPAAQARRQRRRARPRRRASWTSTREPAGSPSAISANSARTWDSIMAGGLLVDLVLRRRGGLTTRTAGRRRPERPAHRLQRLGRLALHGPR